MVAENLPVGDDGVPRVDFNYTLARSERESNEQWSELRERCPVAWSDHFGGHWVLSGYDEVVAAFKDWETFSSTRNDPALTPMIIVPTPMGPNIPQEMDPPAWRPYRHLFTGLLAEALEPARIYKWVDAYLDRVIESGRMDLTYDYASPATAAVVLEWLGWPEDEWPRVSKAYHNATGFAPGMPEFDQAVVDLGWMSQRIAEEVADRRTSPRDDAITAFALAKADGEPVSDEYSQSMVRLAIAGGVETTVSATTSALVHLALNPKDKEALIADPSLMDSAIEEFLRVYPPVRSHGRTVHKDTSELGCPMHTGERVLLSQASANHDPKAFPRADEFLIDRTPNKHVSFGMGVHRCPGSALGRLEMKAMIGRMLERIPDFRVVEEELQAYPSWGISGGWAKAPVEFTPGTRRGTASS